MARPSCYPVVARCSAGEIGDGTASGPARRDQDRRTAVAARGRRATRALRHSLGAGVAAARGAGDGGGTVPGPIMARALVVAAAAWPRRWAHLVRRARAVGGVSILVFAPAGFCRRAPPARPRQRTAPSAGDNARRPPRGQR